MRLSLSPALLAWTACVHSVAAITATDAQDGFNTLQSWYNESIGLWIPSTGWWNSANCLTMIADLAAIDDVVKAQALAVYPNTFVRAQQYNLQMSKTVGPGWLMQSFYGSHWPFFPPGWPRPPFQPTNGFLDGYYDDEGWWALAWIAVYDVTGDQEYLQTAMSIFDNMQAAYGTTPCNGGIWDKAHTYVNAIANELFLDVAAHLANRAGSQSAYYRSWALKQWAWFQQSGMINAQHTINDGLNDTTCQNNGGTVWSYNQGVILGALAELSRATADASYLATAKQIADAAIAALTVDGVLHDPCEPDCGADGSQFKGVFARNLQILQKASPEARYAQFLQTNANAIWADDRDAADQLSVVWSGPFDAPANASTQSSAMDAIVGALATS